MQETMKMFKWSIIQGKLVTIKMIDLLPSIENWILFKIRLNFNVFLQLESGAPKNGLIENEALKPYLMWIKQFTEEGVKADWVIRCALKFLLCKVLAFT